MDIGRIKVVTSIMPLSGAVIFLVDALNSGVDYNLQELAHEARIELETVDKANCKAFEAEVGYWIGVPFWGRGLIPEAVRELMRYAFNELGIKKLWCGYFDGNEKSKRVQEKCDFQYQDTIKDKEWPLMDDVRT